MDCLPEYLFPSGYSIKATIETRLILLTIETISSAMTQQKIPRTGSRSHLDGSMSAFLHEIPDLHLGGQEDFRNQHRKYLKVLGIHTLPKYKVHPIQEFGFTAIRGPHGTIPEGRMIPRANLSRNDRKIGENIAEELAQFTSLLTWGNLINFQLPPNRYNLYEWHTIMLVLRKKGLNLLLKRANYRQVQRYNPS